MEWKNRYGRGGKACPPELRKYQMEEGAKYSVVSFNFTAKDLKFLNDLKTKTGISKTIIIKHAIREVSKSLLKKYKKAKYNWEQ